MSVRNARATMGKRQAGAERVGSDEPNVAQTDGTLSQGETANIGSGGTSRQDIFIAIMGITGSGKSTLISKLVGDQVVIGHDLGSCTQKVDIYHFDYNDHTKVYLVDTPGFDDSDKSDFHVLTEIASFLKASYQDGLKLNGIIYLHRIIDNRMQGSAMRSITMFRKIIGGSVYPNIILASTMWELEKPGVGEARESNLIGESEFWSTMRQKGCQIRRHMNTKASALELVSFFVKDRTDKVVLDLQVDLVTKKKDLADTAAGKEARGQLAEEVMRLKRQVEDAKTALKEALKERQQARARELHKERVEWSKKMDKLQKDYETSSQKMRQDFEEARKRQEAMIKSILQQNKKLGEARDRIEKKLTSRTTSPPTSTPLWPVWSPDAVQPHGRNPTQGRSAPRTAMLSALADLNLSPSPWRPQALKKPRSK